MRVLNRILEWVVFGVCIVVALLCLMYIVHFVNKVESTPATQLETVYFTLITTILTLIASIGITYFLSRRKAAEDLRLLGQSAIRHIKQIMISTRILTETTEQKTGRLKRMKRENEQVNIDLMLEYFDNISKQMTALSAGVNTAKNDWANVLSEEMEESIESDEIILGYLEKIKALREEIEKKDEVIKTQDEERDKESAEYEHSIREKEGKIELLKKAEEDLRNKIIQIESKPYFWPTDINTAIPSSGSGISGITGIAPSPGLLGLHSTCDICHANPAVLTCSKCGKEICHSCQSSPFTPIYIAPICKECSR